MCNQKQRIYLTGMMGCGKTTLGKLLANELNTEFYDLDTRLETQVGKNISDIFEQDGEAIFRKYETQVLYDTDKLTGVFATGGGIILNAQNIDFMKQHGRIIFIDRPVENIAQDVDTQTRPLLQDKINQLHIIHAKRIDVYKNTAHASFDNTYEDPLLACKALLKTIDAIK